MKSYIRLNVMIDVKLFYKLWRVVYIKEKLGGSLYVVYEVKIYSMEIMGMKNYGF